jgi:hypothetical protein
MTAAGKADSTPDLRLDPLVGSGGEDLLGAVIDRGALLPSGEVASLAAEQVMIAGGQDVACWLLDADQLALQPLEGAGLVAGERTLVEESFLGRAFMSEEGLEQNDADGSTRLFLPLMDGSNRIGVLAFTLRDSDASHRKWALRFARLVALLIVAKGRYTDEFVNTRRSKEMSLGAQLQWQLLPPLTMRTARVALAGILEPAYEVGGDSFDYALNGQLLHLAIFDAMGHGLDASVMATVIIAAYRLGRRAGSDLVELYAGIDQTMGRQFGSERFATGQLAQLDTASGVVSWVNAGHPAPLLIRGQRVIRELIAPPGLPLGLRGDRPEVQTEQLQPGDRLLFLSDGILEERLADGDLFGPERLRDFIERAALKPGAVDQLLRRLSQSLMIARGGRTSDDATLLLVEWQGSGADQSIDGASNGPGWATSHHEL